MPAAIAPSRAPAAPELWLGQGEVELRETHASWVYLAGEDAYKIKKPVRLAFLDYSTLARRRAACREELRVNRTLAPSIYVEVCALVPGGGGALRLAAEDTPGAVEYAVHMRRFDETRTLHGIIQAGALTPAVVCETAARVADFHSHAPVVAGGEPSQVLEMWLRNLAELDSLAAAPAWQTQQMRAFARAFVSAHGEELRRRAAEGYVRDGHGDLRCEHVLFGRARDEPVQIVDRIEFDPALRHVDVACDLAFLAMDLEAHRRRSAARTLVRAYRRAGGSPGSEQLRSFYGAYWALVRAKVAMIAAGDGGTSARRERAHAARLQRLAECLCWRARTPLAIVVCGAPASGKSTLAAALSRSSGIPVVSSDVVRKRLAGLEATTRAAPQHYTRAFSRATYERLSREALVQLERRGGVIVDASCYEKRQRALLFHRLQRAGAGFLVVQCQVPLTTTLARARQRMHSADRVSDATPAIAAERFRHFQALDELAPASVLTLDGELDLHMQLAAVTRAVDERMQAPGATHALDLRARAGPYTEAPCFTTADAGVSPVDCARRGA